MPRSALSRLSARSTCRQDGREVARGVDDARDLVEPMTPAGGAARPPRPRPVAIRSSTPRVRSSSRRAPMRSKSRPPCRAGRPRACLASARPTRSSSARGRRARRCRTGPRTVLESGRLPRPPRAVREPRFEAWTRARVVAVAQPARGAPPRPLPLARSSSPIRKASSAERRGRGRGRPRRPRRPSPRTGPGAGARRRGARGPSRPARAGRGPGDERRSPVARAASSVSVRGAPPGRGHPACGGGSRAPRAPRGRRVRCLAEEVEQRGDSSSPPRPSARGPRRRPRGRRPSGPGRTANRGGGGSRTPARDRCVPLRSRLGRTGGSRGSRGGRDPQRSRERSASARHSLSIASLSSSARFQRGRRRGPRARADEVAPSSGRPPRRRPELSSAAAGRPLERDRAERASRSDWRSSGARGPRGRGPRGLGLGAVVVGPLEAGAGGGVEEAGPLLGVPTAPSSPRRGRRGRAPRPRRRGAGGSSRP